MKPWSLKLEPRWCTVAFLAVAYLFNYADRSAVSAVLPLLKTEFQLTDSQLGLLGSVFLWSYAAASLVAGSLADRFPRRTLVLVSLLLWSFVTVLTGFAAGLVALLALRVALGLSESLFVPAAIALTADHHGTPTRGRALSILVMGLNVGVVFGGLSAGYLADHHGWRAGFWTLGSLGLAFGLIFQPLLAGSPQSATAGPARRPPVLEAARYLIRTPSYHVMLAKSALAGIGVWIFLSWLPLFYRESYGLSLAAAGFMGTLMQQGATAVGILAGGWISDAFAARGVRRRMLLHGHGYLVAAPFLLIFLLQPSPALASVAVALFSFFRGVGGANEQPITCDVVPTQYRSTGVGFMNAFSTAVGGTGVYLTGVLKSTMELNTIFALISVVFVTAAGALYLGYFRFAAHDTARAAAVESRTA